MRYDNACNAILLHLRANPEFGRIRELLLAEEGDEQMIEQIVGSAALLAADVLAPLNRTPRFNRPRLEAGRVHVATEHHAAWSAFVDGGWTTLEAPKEFGGAGLPQVIHAACEELFNRASPAFGMLPTSMRCAARLLQKYGSEEMKSEWLPPLIAGSCGATICISEAGAGSDVPRLRTLAVPQPDGTWRVSGEKMWISFGDHDLTERIAHMVLARTPGAPAGSEGLSLFLVPDRVGAERNSVTVRRIEKKLGLHGSPTCQLGLEDARGWLIGEQGRGLPQLFTMIVGMRLSVGSQGAGIAGAAAALAWRYAEERCQGGPPEAPPVPLSRHGDVRRMLLSAASRAEVARGLVLLTALTADMELHETAVDARQEAASLLAWLLPITKNFCAEAAFSCASEAIQVLGGAGYTLEWPAEQYLRDARVLSIYEGTSGMQALDLTLRRTLGRGGSSLDIFLARAKRDLALAGDPWTASQFQMLLSMLQEAVGMLSRQNAEIVCTPFLQLASLATTGWVALRLTSLRDSNGDHLRALGRHWLRMAVPLAQAELAQIGMKDDLTVEFDKIELEKIA